MSASASTDGGVPVGNEDDAAVAAATADVVVVKLKQLPSPVRMILEFCHFFSLVSYEAFHFIRAQFNLIQIYLLKGSCREHIFFVFESHKNYQMVEKKNK